MMAFSLMRDDSPVVGGEEGGEGVSVGGVRDWVSVGEAKERRALFPKRQR
jgi:hypothetical protein